MFTDIFLLMENKVHFIVEPGESMYDEQIHIQVKGLIADELVTVVALCKPTSSSSYFSYAHYVANNEGNVDITEMQSIGGSYVGVEPMGLFWSISPFQNDQSEQTKDVYAGMMHPDAAFDIAFMTYRGLLSDHDVKQRITKISNTSPREIYNQLDSHFLAYEQIKRFTVAPSTKRLVVRDGRLRGVLFVPQGKGPFPAVLFIDGAIPGVHEFKASLFSTHGYVTLALAYFGFDDLPKDKSSIEIEYFVEALQWLASLPEVNEHQIGVSGFCMGGTLALYLSLTSPLVRAVTVINACSYLMLGKVSYNHEQLFVFHDSSKVVRSGDTYDFHATTPIIEKHVVAIDLVSNPIQFLFIYGEDNKNISAEHGRCLAQRLQKAGKTNFKLLTFPDAGHVINVPNYPVITSAYYKHEESEGRILLGGKLYAHAHAAESAWREQLEFFGRHLQV